MRKRGTIYALFLCLCFLFNGCMNKSVNMTMKLKKGDSYKIEVDRSEKITQIINNAKTSIESKIRVGYLCQVSNIDDNRNADIRVTFDTMDVKAGTNTGQTSSNKQSNESGTGQEKSTENANKDAESSGTGQQNANNNPGNQKGTDNAQKEDQTNQQPITKDKQPPTENKEALSQGMDKLSKIYTALIGKSFSVKMGEYGKVKQVTGMDEVVNKIFAEMNVKDEKEKEDIKKVMKEQFGEEAITKRIERITAVYPNKDVKMGEGWKEKRDISVQFPVEAENNYSLKESSDGTSDITIDSQIKEREGAEPTVIDTIKVSYEELKGAQKGNVSLNEETGMVKRAELESNFAGKMKFTSDDPNMGSMIFPISVEEKILVNVLRQ